SHAAASSMPVAALRLVGAPDSAPAGNFLELRFDTGMKGNDRHVLVFGKELMRSPLGDDVPLLPDRVVGRSEGNHRALDAADVRPPVSIDHGHVLHAVRMVVPPGRYIALQQEDPARLDGWWQHDGKGVQGDGCPDEGLVRAAELRPQSLDRGRERLLPLKPLDRRVQLLEVAQIHRGPHGHRRIPCRYPASPRAYARITSSATVRRIVTLVSPRPSRERSRDGRPRQTIRTRPTPAPCDRARPLSSKPAGRRP